MRSMKSSYMVTGSVPFQTYRRVLKALAAYLRSAEKLGTRTDGRDFRDDPEANKGSTNLGSGGALTRRTRRMGERIGLFPRKRRRIRRCLGMFDCSFMSESFFLVLASCHGGIEGQTGQICCCPSGVYISKTRQIVKVRKADSLQSPRTVMLASRWRKLVCGLRGRGGRRAETLRLSLGRHPLA